MPLEVGVKTARVLVVAAIVCALVTVGAHAAKAPYVIGAIFDVTGTGAPLGTPEKLTVQMIAAQLNKSGGVNGHPVKVIVMDNGSDSTQSVMAANKLIDRDHVKAIIGTSTTGTTLAIAGICSKAGIPLISCAAGVKIVQPVKPYVFKTAQSDVYAVTKVLDYLKSRRIKRVAFIGVSNAFGNSGKEQMMLQAPRAGIQIIVQQQFGPDDSDMTPQLVNINRAKPQAVVCWGTNPGPAIVARNMKQLGMKMPLIMSHGISDKKFIELAGSAANGVIFPTGRIIVANAIPNSDRQKKTLLTYSSQFKKAYGKDADHFGGHAWDATWLVVNALRKVGDNPGKIRTQIENTKNFVGIGGVFNFSRRDHNGLGKEAFVMVQIKNGKWTLLK
jgi:branched-chain amino acid transport system substrate-binding protein